MEGTPLLVCEQCKDYGVPYVGPERKPAIQKRSLKPIKRTISKKQTSIRIPEEEVVGDFPQLIREGRNKLNLTKKELALQINEKLSVLQKLEQGKLNPDLSLCRKLEQTLKIKLITQNTVIEAPPYKNEKIEPTLGDIAHIKKKK